MGWGIEALLESVDESPGPSVELESVENPLSPPWWSTPLESNDGPPAPPPASAPAAAPNDMKSPSTVTEVEAMSVKQLKALLVGRGVSTEGCLDKDDLIARVNSSSTPPASFVRAMSADQLKQVPAECSGHLFERTRTNSLPVLPNLFLHFPKLNAETSCCDRIWT